MKKSPFILDTDLNSISDDERKALPYLVNATKLIDQLYWSQYNENRPGGNLYPPDITKDELERELRLSPDLGRINTIVKRDATNKLVAIPYEVEYEEMLFRVSNEIKKAASIIKNESFRDYLIETSRALLNGNYMEKDELWIGIESSNIDLIIGPNETYIDRLMGLKGGYEGILSIKDYESLRQLSSFEEVITSSGILNSIDIQYLRPINSRLAVNNVLIFSGHANAHKMNAKVLPNDSDIIRRKGHKKILFKNIIELRFQKIIKPIIDKMVNFKQGELVDMSYESLEKGLFKFLLIHELGHNFSISDSFSKENFKEFYLPIEEVKAHIMSLYITNKLYELKNISLTELLSVLVSSLGYFIADIRLGTIVPTKTPYKIASLFIMNNFIENKFLNLNDEYISIKLSTLTKNLTILNSKLYRIINEKNIYNVEKAVLEINNMKYLKRYMNKLSGIPINI